MDMVVSAIGGGNGTTRYGRVSRNGTRVRI